MDPTKGLSTDKFLIKISVKGLWDGTSLRDKCFKGINNVSTGEGLEAKQPAVPCSHIYYQKGIFIPPSERQSPKTMSIWTLSRKCRCFFIGLPLAGLVMVVKSPIVVGNSPVL